MKRIACLLLIICAFFGAAAAAEGVENDLTFTIAWLSDTQRAVYQENLRPQVTAAVDWIRENAGEKNILCLFQTGDFADNMHKKDQAAFVDATVARLAPIPFLGVAGNHDIGVIDPNYRSWLERPFVIAAPEENKYEGGKCMSRLLKSGDSEIIAVGLCYGMRTDPNALEWIREQFNAHPEATGILLCHEFLNSKGQYLLAYPVLEEVVANCPNIRLILCGHCHNNIRTSFTFDDDGDGTAERTVNALMFDYQEEWNDKLAYIVLLTFHPEDRSLSVTTYSPFLNDYICHDDIPDAECFTLENAF